MNAVLIVELDDDINLDDVEICYVVQDKYGTPIKAEVDGVKLRPIPEKMILEMVLGNEFAVGCVRGWNDCIDEITGEKDESNISD